LKSAAYEGRNLVSIKDYYKNDRRGHGARTQGMMHSYPIVLPDRFQLLTRARSEGRFEVIESEV
jgi:hypothetical protein